MSSNLASHLKNLTGSKITDHKKRKVQKDTTGRHNLLVNVHLTKFTGFYVQFSLRSENV